ncbi:hypothetical protein ACGGAQ_29855 [Micromonospora sp. NPDC047557]|uniref:hypothetical protein n=1 Tax=Micromonospora sp. NPDC047557 TaxID=3364250 RepID=UPI00371E116F
MFEAYEHLEPVAFGQRSTGQELPGRSVGADTGQPVVLDRRMWLSVPAAIVDKVDGAIIHGNSVNAAAETHIGAAPLLS